MNKLRRENEQLRDLVERCSSEFRVLSMDLKKIKVVEAEKRSAVMAFMRLAFAEIWRVFEHLLIKLTDLRDREVLTGDTLGGIETNIYSAKNDLEKRYDRAVEQLNCLALESREVESSAPVQDGETMLRLASAESATRKLDSLLERVHHLKRGELLARQEQPLASEHESLDLGERVQNVLRKYKRKG
jgi:hypothetical protein